MKGKVTREAAAGEFLMQMLVVTISRIMVVI